ncbi:MAG: type II toxin-antitoxin system RelE/ParE family toxin [Pirellulales bacterium]
MSSPLVFTKRAAQELEEAARWWAENRSVVEAERWYAAYMRAIVSLENNPQRCPFARENGKLPYEVRQLAFGLGRRFTHRAVFTIRNNAVVVLSIRHLARQDIVPDEFE